MNLLDGLSALNIQTVVETMQVKQQLESQIETFGKLEKQVFEVEIKHQEVSRRFQSKKSGLDEAMAAVQRAAEALRMAENELTVAQTRLSVAKESHTAWREELMYTKNELRKERSLRNVARQQ